MKTYKTVGIKGYNGKNIEVTDVEKNSGKPEKREMDIRDVLYTTLNHIPLRTMKDSIEGSRLALALDKSRETGVISIEEGTHEWVKESLKTQLTLVDQTKAEILVALFGLNAHIFFEMITEGFDKPVPPA